MLRYNADALGFRAKLGVIGPSTNTIVQPDFEMLRPVGVTNHYSRIPVENVEGVTDAAFVAATNVIGDNTLEAVKWAMTCAPDRLVMGMSAVTFYGGIAGAQAFRHRMEDYAGIEATIGSQALAAALGAFGNVRRVAFLSPYFPSANKAVKGFLEESGFEVVRDLALQRPSWLAIAETGEREVVDALKAIDGDDVDALVQVGTNLSMVRIAAAAELWLDKPVVAINTATYWHALRALGIEDKIYGAGRLLERH
ncbi:arylmalonate decarboxylase [Novosphingobium sp. BL-52-GroH]|uniref:maleate cis-trans isomerase family protein n=1 Tax=Novosphingobium sp. BL-52-GroH TaxID=3349877 RepID=UPI0038505046